MRFQQYLEENFDEQWEPEWASADIIEDGIQYAFGTGGKRIRPLLCLKMCDALDGDTEKAAAFAKAVEALHNYTLVHDDVMDGDEYRRGEKAVWQEFGLTPGILIGDAIHSMAYQIVIDSDRFSQATKLDLLHILSDTDRQVHDGQGLDIGFRGREQATQSDYMEMVREKTGALISAGLRGSGIIADVDSDTMQRIREFGRTIGPAFQIRDDVIDLVGEKGRKQRGNDIREGKRSLIVVTSLQRLDDPQELLTILDKDREHTSQEDVEAAIALMRSVDAIEDSDQKAEDLAEEAKRILEEIQDYDMSAVLDVADFLVERKF